MLKHMFFGKFYIYLTRICSFAKLAELTPGSTQEVVPFDAFPLTWEFLCHFLFLQETYFRRTRMLKDLFSYVSQLELQKNQLTFF